MPKPALAALMIVALVAVGALLLVGGGDPADTGLGETATATPMPTAGVNTGERAPLQPATVATSAGGTTVPATYTGATNGGGTGPAAPNGEPHQVAAGQAIKGVVRAPGGLPAVGAQVLLTIHTPDGPKIRNGRTDANGRFEIIAPAEGRATLQVQASGLATVAMPVDSGAGVEVDPPPAVQIAGVVRDGEGAPVAGAFITADEIGSPVTPARSLAQSGPDGTFTIGSLRRDARYRLSATHATRAPSDPIEVTAPTAGAQLTLFEGATLIVKVFDADGGTLTNAPAKSVQAGWQSLRSFAEVHGPGGSRTLSNWTTSDPLQLELTGLAAGEYRVILQARGHGKVEKSGIHVPRSGTVETEARLTRGGTVRVTVVDQDGKPLPNVVVSDAASSGTAFGMLIQDETGTEGMGRVGPLPAGTHRVQASRPGFLTGFADADVQSAFESSARIVLKPR